MENESKKRIVKNSGILYLRMFVTMGITLYTTRILLKALGFEDFGIYNLIGGVVSIFWAIKILFASAIQRFLNYEMGRNDKDQLRKIFSMGINIQFILAVVFFILIEIIGGWFIENKLDIPSGRLSAAYYVLHFSALTVVVSMMTTPFDAVIMANEKMNVLALLTTFETVLKIIIAYIVLNNDSSSIDNLKLYATLFLVVSLIIRFSSSLYCRRSFEECKYKFFWDNKMFKKLGAFSGWNFLGNLAQTLPSECINILLNLFGGVVFNAARAITQQVHSATINFIRNIIFASTPQIIQLYAQEKKEDAVNLAYSSARFSFFISMIIFLPLFIYMDVLLEQWLGDVPPYTGTFSRLILLFLVFRVFHDSIDILFKASGKIKLYMITDFCFFIFMLLSSYLLLKKGFPIQTPYIMWIISEALNVLVISIWATKMKILNISSCVKKVVIPCFNVASISVLLVYFITQFITTSNVLALLGSIAICVFVVLLVILSIGLTKTEKQKLGEFCSKLIK